MRGWWLVVALVACKDDAPATKPPVPKPAPIAAPSATSAPSASRDGDSLTPQPFHEQAEGTAKPAEATLRHYRAAWANVVNVSPTCWFFSGPSGRDTPLPDRLDVRIENGHAWVTWGKATFEGTWGDSSIEVVRLATHSYQGTWSVFEKLWGPTKEKGIHAKYTYDECQNGTPCEGECRITADVLLVEER